MTEDAKATTLELIEQLEERLRVSLGMLKSMRKALAYTSQEQIGKLGTIHLTRSDFETLRRLQGRAVAEGLPSYMFKGMEIATDYGTYLVQAIAPKFEVKK